MPIDRTVFDASVDDSGSGTSGTVINKTLDRSGDSRSGRCGPAIRDSIGVSVYHNAGQNCEP